MSQRGNMQEEKIDCFYSKSTDCYYLPDGTPFYPRPKSFRVDIDKQLLLKKLVAYYIAFNKDFGSGTWDNPLGQPVDSNGKIIWSPQWDEEKGEWRKQPDD